MNYMAQTINAFKQVPVKQLFRISLINALTLLVIPLLLTIYVLFELDEVYSSYAQRTELQWFVLLGLLQVIAGMLFLIIINARNWCAANKVRDLKSGTFCFYLFPYISAVVLFLVNLDILLFDESPVVDHTGPVYQQHSHNNQQINDSENTNIGVAKQNYFELDESNGTPKRFEFRYDDSSSLNQASQFSQLLISYVQTNKLKTDVPVDDETLKKVQALVPGITAAVANSDWDSFMQIAIELNEIVPHDIDVVLNSAVMANAPLEVINELIVMGGTLSSASLVTLATNEEFDKLEALERYGVGLNSGLDADISVLDLALMAPLSSSAFNYIVERTSVTNDVNVFGVDSLGVAIITATNHGNNSIEFITTLIEQGAQLNESHLELLNNLQFENPELHAQITQALFG